MIRSMTAFAQRDIQGNWGKATWELRSTNQRYLETCIRLPEDFRGLEPIIRNRINTHLFRGKVECTLRFDVNTSKNNTLILDKKLSKQLIKAAKWIKSQSDKGKIDPLAILRWPGVIATNKQDMDTISTELMAGLDAVLHDFIHNRKNEGTALKKMIEQRLVNISAEIRTVRQQLPNILLWQRKKLLDKLEEVQIHLEHNRLEQELLILAQRLDVAEELDRLEVHVKETYNTLTRQGAVGRRLDFMMQEFNRESNTIASKSIHPTITASAIELKVLIEQMREQIQNIE